MFKKSENAVPFLLHSLEFLKAYDI